MGIRLHLLSWTTEPLEIEADENVYLFDALSPHLDKLESFRKFPITVSHNIFVRDSRGVLLEIRRKVGDFGFKDNERLFLEPGGMFKYDTGEE